MRCRSNRHRGDDGRKDDAADVGAERYARRIGIADLATEQSTRSIVFSHHKDLSRSPRETCLNGSNLQKAEMFRAGGSGNIDPQATVKDCLKGADQTRASGRQISPVHNISRIQPIKTKFYSYGNAHPNMSLTAKWQGRTGRRGVLL